MREILAWLVVFVWGCVIAGFLLWAYRDGALLLAVGAAMLGAALVWAMDVLSDSH